MVYHLKEWVQGNAKVTRKHDDDKGGTMRLGAYDADLLEGSRVSSVYGAPRIEERHRHRYEVNNSLIGRIQEAGLNVGGWSEDDTLVEMVELNDHPWFVACQFHPEFTSTPRDGHPLFASFIQAAMENKK